MVDPVSDDYPQEWWLSSYAPRVQPQLLAHPMFANDFPQVKKKQNRGGVHINPLVLIAIAIFTDIEFRLRIPSPLLPSGGFSARDLDHT